MGGRASRRARAGTAGLEFALIAPVMVTLFLGTIDLSNALLMARRMEIAAGAVAEIASTSAAQARALNILTTEQAWQATTAAFAYFPGWAAQPPRRGFAVTLSGIAFTASGPDCSAGCSYKGHVAWSVANDLGATELRACGPVASAPDTAASSYLAIPAGSFGPTSLLVADISATYRPYFFGFIIGAIPMMQSAYISPRIGSGTVLQDDGGAGVSVNCAAAS